MRGELHVPCGESERSSNQVGSSVSWWRPLGTLTVPNKNDTPRLGTLAQAL